MNKKLKKIIIYLLRFIILYRYHNKLIFDCLREALEYFRPFDIRGKSL